MPNEGWNKLKVQNPNVKHLNFELCHLNFLFGLWALTFELVL
jgi:hypothetical protein